MTDKAASPHPAEQQEDVLSRIAGRTGILTLNRPQALNALSLPMFRVLAETLDAWEKDGNIDRVVIDSSSPRAFCAGGDVKAVAREAELARRGKDPGRNVRNLFREEYKLNTRIHNFSKPYIALARGIVMGGGIGIGLHGSHVVVTETTKAAMPEVKIGFFPDIGFGVFYAKMPGLTGLYMAMTGESISGRDMMALGLATHFVPEENWEDVTAEIRTGDADKALAPYAYSGEDGFALQQKIDLYFSGGSVEQIVAALAADAISDPWCEKIHDILRAACPASIKTAFRHFYMARRMTRIEDVIKMDYRLSQNMCWRHDFYEGVRALLIDKDGVPRWSPSRLEDVTEKELETLFGKCLNGEEDLVLSPPVARP